LNAHLVAVSNNGYLSFSPSSQSGQGEFVFLQSEGIAAIIGGFPIKQQAGVSLRVATANVMAHPRREIATNAALGSKATTAPLITRTNGFAGRLAHRVLLAWIDGGRTSGPPRL